MVVLRSVVVVGGVGGGGGYIRLLNRCKPKYRCEKSSLFTYNPSPHVYVLNFVVDNIWHAYMNTV